MAVGRSCLFLSSYLRLMTIYSSSSWLSLAWAGSLSLDFIWNIILKNWSLSCISFFFTSSLLSIRSFIVAKLSTEFSTQICLLKFPPQRKNCLKKKYTTEYIIRSLCLDPCASSLISSLFYFLTKLMLISLLLSLLSLKSFICSWMNCTKISTIKFWCSKLSFIRDLPCMAWPIAISMVACTLSRSIYRSPFSLSKYSLNSAFMSSCWTSDWGGSGIFQMISKRASSRSSNFSTKKSKILG